MKLLIYLTFSQLTKEACFTIFEKLKSIVCSLFAIIDDTFSLQKEYGKKKFEI
jgi:hypothetical protein